MKPGTAFPALAAVLRTWIVPLQAADPSPPPNTWRAAAPQAGWVPVALRPPAAAAANGPLRVHSTNPRSFTDGTNNPDGSPRAAYLTGSHTWNNVDWSG